MTDSLEDLSADPSLEKLALPDAGGAQLSAIGNTAKRLADRFVGATDQFIGTPSRAMQPHQPTVPGMWSDEDEAIRQLDQRHTSDWASNAAIGTVFDPALAIMQRLAAPVGSYALRNMKTTPVDHDPFVGETALGIFAGPGAKTANMAKLDRAKALLEQGTDPVAIWKETGWFQGADNKWRFEINDAPAKFNPGEHKQVRPMREVVEHPELYEAYPDLAKIKTETFSASGEGWHQPAKSPTTPASERIRTPTGNLIYDDSRILPSIDSVHSSKNVALHELQHAVQTREGFATGGSPEEMLPLAIEQVKISPTLYGKQKDIAFEAYQRLAGEVEARNIQRRSVEGVEQPPWKTEDRPRDVQTVRGHRGGSSSVGPGATPPRIGKQTAQAGLPELAGQNVPGIFRPGEWAPRESIANPHAANINSKNDLARTKTPAVYGENVPQFLQREPGGAGSPQAANVNSKNDLARTNQLTDSALSTISEALKLAPKDATGKIEPGMFGRVVSFLKSLGKATPVDHDPFK